MTATNQHQAGQLQNIARKTVTVTRRNGNVVVKAPYNSQFSVTMRAFGCPSSIDSGTRSYIVPQAHDKALWAAISYCYKGCELVSSKGTRVI